MAERAAEGIRAALSTSPGWYVELNTADRLIGRLVRAQRLPLVGGYLHELLILRGTDIHPLAEIGEGLRLRHGGIGVVIHSHTRIGTNVTIYPGVTIGRADVWRRGDDIGGFDIGADAVICAGAALLARGDEPVTIGERAVIGANAVVTSSVPTGEIWAGQPARRVGLRD